MAHVGPMSGLLAGNGKANAQGAKAYFDQVNAQGGINGLKVRVVTEDDQYKASETIRLVQEVARRDKPVAFINLLGSANVTEMLKDKTFDKVATPFVGITPGAEALRKPGSPWMFHVQAGDRAQLRKVLSLLATIGLNKVAVVYQDIPFGQSGLGFVDEMAPGLKVDIAARISVPSASEDFKTVAQQLNKTDAKAYLMILTPNSGGAMVRDLRAAGNLTPIYSMSYVSAGAILEKAPLKDAVGIALAQVASNPDSDATSLSRDFRAAMSKFLPDVKERSSMQMIGYINARVTGEAIRRAGPNPTPDKVAAALRQLQISLGGYMVDFTGANKNVGADFVDIGVINHQGKLMY
ncbi:lipoprotein [Comamonas phosphati]|nr:lipoprotein [Comamonas phosphati]